MGKRGGTRHLKRISAPKALMIERKAKTWIQRPLPGPHKIATCAPISHILKVIGIASTMKEVRKMLTSRSVLVDGRAVTEPKYAIGFMDVITFGDNSWRMLFDEKGRLIAKVTKDDKSKVCRIEKKTRIAGGKIQFTLHDGKALMSKEGKVGDCILISLPDQKQKKVYSVGGKMNCIIIGGKHVGKNAVVEEIIPGTATRPAQVKCDIDGTLSITLKEYIFPVGDFKI